MITEFEDIAAEIIKSGGIVAFPTETVYGLGADATNEKACQEIFLLKGRPKSNPLIVHVESLQQAFDIGEFSDQAKLLVESFWPGPLTVVVPLKVSSDIAYSVTAGLSTIALRMPANKMAQKLIKKSCTPLAAPSANISSYISATSYEHVVSDFFSYDICILKSDKKCEYGIESTIIDMSSSTPALLRFGFVSADSIERVLNTKISTDTAIYSEMALLKILLNESSGTFKAPGMMHKHYSPKTPIRLNAVNIFSREVSLNFGNSKLEGVYSLNLSKKGDLIEAASNLYLMLRLLDDYAMEHTEIKQIAVATIPSVSIGSAINDRLNRAAQP